MRFILRLLSVLSLLYIAIPRHVEGTYSFFVELQSFSNPDDRDFEGVCCDPGCGDCENYFVVCLRQAGYDEDSNLCPYSSFSTSADPDSGSYLTFTTGDDALAPGIPNPLRFQGNTWPGGFQLKIRALDADPDADDLIDYFIIEEPSFLPTNEWTNFTTYRGEHSNNVRITLRYRLRCRGNWHGHNCDVLCTDIDTADAHLECALDGSYVCMEGWEDLSTDCTVPVCEEGCHPEGGSCSLPGDCNCEEGWSGDLCDVCTPAVGCDHGYCTHPNDCTCEEGYSGTLCNIDLDPCGHATPCVHGDCTNEGGGLYSCACETGYTGTDCDVDIDDCLPDPCENGGTCVDLVNGLLCSCSVGWTGDTCGENIDECVEMAPCRNGSTCMDCPPTVFGDCPLGYTCSCLPGFFGDHCDLDIDHCSPPPCLNGGTCHDGLLAYTCTCPPGYTGLNCETEFDYCREIQPCKNGSTCTNLLMSELYMCECFPGFTGRDCDVNIDDCPGNSCVPAHTRACLDRVGGYECDCLLGYDGTLCETEIDECELYGCRNGGTCLDGLGDFTCLCPRPYSGKECEEFVDPELCGDAKCKEGEACIIDVDIEKCVPCTGDLGDLLDGCDKEPAAQSDNKDSTDNTPAIIGASLGGVVLLITVLLLLVLFCCCRTCLLLLCPCLGRRKVEEREEEPGTLSGPYSRVSQNAMYLGADLFASGGKASSTLTRSEAMQNPMYAAPGGVKSDSLTKVPLPLGSASPYLEPHPNGRRHSTRPASKSYENVTSSPGTQGGAREEEVTLQDLDVDHPYEQLEDYQMRAALTDEYQRLSGGERPSSTHSGTGPYASLYNVPSSSSFVVSPPTPPRPTPHYMPLTAGPRPENPYVIAAGTPTTSDAVSTPTTSPTTPEKNDLAKEEMETSLSDEKSTKNA